jgi:hypothetical protein
MTKKILFIVLSSLSFFYLSAQEEDHHDHETNHEHEHHHSHEIGFSVAPVYFIEEGNLSLSTHLHYTYYIPETKFGIGLGYEHVFDEHKHNFVGAELSYRIIHPLSISLSPGVLYEGEHPDEKQFALHIETAYEFEVGAIHIGPAFEVAWHPEDIHVSLGVHFGLGL